MKFFSLFSFIFCFSMQLHCQNNFYVNWEQPNNFLKYNLSKVSVYEFEVKKNGRLKKDSLLLRYYEYDKDKAMIKGINHNWFVSNHDGGSNLNVYSFKKYYSKDSLLVSKVEIPVLKEKLKKDKIEINFTVKKYEYDSFNNVIKDVFYSEYESIILYKKDTLNHFKIINNPKIIEYKYDSKNRKIKQFITTDSTQYFSKYDMKSKSSKSCFNCEEKYLAQEWKYENDELIEWINYTYKKEKHTKRNYFYDENSNLIKQIDSTGWYMNNANPFLDSITEIIYNDNGKIVTTIDNIDKTFPNHYYKNIIYYNNQNQIIKREEYSKNQVDIHEYIYENSNLKYQFTNYGNNDFIKYEYLYNEKGLIKEQKHLINNNLVRIEKYYYN